MIRLPALSRLFLALIALVFAVGPDIAAPQPLLAVSAASSASSLRENNVGPFHFSHPWDWEMQEMGTQSVTLYMRDDLGNFARFSRIWISIEPVYADLSSDKLDTEFVASSTISSDSTTIGDWYLPGFHLISKEDAMLLGRPGRRYAYTAERLGLPIRGETLSASFDRKLLKVTYQSTPEHFDLSRPVVDVILQTLQLASSSSSLGRQRTNALLRSSSSAATSFASTPAAVSGRPSATTKPAKKTVRKSVKKPVRKAIPAPPPSSSKYRQA